jgi:ferredoxin-NADP reductase
VFFEHPITRAIALIGIPSARCNRRSTVAYLCGPVPFMRSVRAQLLARGMPAADIHYEVFGPDLGLDHD